jgi:DNA repair protein RadC
MLDEHILDYRHLQDHVVEASHVLYREGMKQAVQWREEMMALVCIHPSDLWSTYQKSERQVEPARIPPYTRPREAA